MCLGVNGYNLVSKTITMKTISTLILFFLTINMYSQKSLSISAQYGNGTTAILNQNAYGNTELDPLPKSASNSGILISYSLNENIALQTGFCNLNMGGYWEGKDGGVETTRDINLKYGQIPINIKYFGKQKFHLYTSLGLGVQFLKSANQLYTPESNMDINPVRFDENGDITNRFNKNSLSAMYAFGFEYKSGIFFCNLGFNLNYGLNDINESDFHIKNKSGVYEASKNGLGFVSLGIGVDLFHSK